jgi:CRP/FNR family transcriptional regulator, cyclic AMP receptor protein
MEATRSTVPTSVFIENVRTEAAGRGVSLAGRERIIQDMTKVRLLEADPDLARYLPADSARALAGLLLADVMELPRGEWHPSLTEPQRGHLGYLLLDGVLVRQITVEGARSAELLGRGDLLRPWLEDPVSFADPEWRVMEPARLAILDRRVGVKLCGRPELSAALIEKAMRRTRSLAVSAATENIRGLETRLLVLFWHLAERFGHRRGGEVVVPLDLTHETLSLLAGARRPSVTTALGALASQGTLTKNGTGGWVLHGPPPGLIEAA